MLIFSVLKMYAHDHCSVVPIKNVVMFSCAPIGSALPLGHRNSVRPPKECNHQECDFITVLSQLKMCLGLIVRQLVMRCG